MIDRRVYTWFKKNVHIKITGRNSSFRLKMYVLFLLRLNT